MNATNNNTDKINARQFPRNDRATARWTRGASLDLSADFSIERCPMERVRVSLASSAIGCGLDPDSPVGAVIDVMIDGCNEPSALRHRKLLCGW